MRRIIAAASIVALFACGEAGDHSAAGATDGAAGAAASSAQTASATDSTSAASRTPVEATRNILFLGTSLTAGLGVGADVAFPADIERRIEADGLPFHVTNAGISGETSAGGVRRIDWLLQNPVDVLVLELGANDGLRALDVDSMRKNLDDILRHTRAKYPDAAIVILGMEAPPNLGAPYTSRFHDVYPALARKYDASLVPFLLAGVAGDRTLNQEDGMHPNAQGHRIVADNVWKVLRPVLVSRAKAAS
jgi:acyl-CoA thioesterase-1